MNVEAYDRFCASLPHATSVMQWEGAHVWKIGGKMFAIGFPNLGTELAITFKCSELSFDLLKDQSGLRPAPYLASRGMLWIQRVNQDSMDDRTLELYLKESYRLVSLKLTKKLQRELGLNR